MGKFNPKELSKLGYTDNVAKSIAIEIINKHCKHYTKEQITDLLQHVIQKPEAFRSNEIWGKLVDVMSPHKKETYNYMKAIGVIKYVSYPILFNEINKKYN